MREGVHQQFVKDIKKEGANKRRRNKALQLSYVCHEVLPEVILSFIESLWMISVSWPTLCHPFTLRNVSVE